MNEPRPNAAPESHPGAISPGNNPTNAILETLNESAAQMGRPAMPAGRPGPAGSVPVGGLAPGSVPTPSREHIPVGWSPGSPPIPADGLAAVIRALVRVAENYAQTQLRKLHRKLGTAPADVQQLLGELALTDDDLESIVQPAVLVAQKYRLNVSNVHEIALALATFDVVGRYRIAFGDAKDQTQARIVQDAAKVVVQNVQNAEKV
jgi:hypothetical protein